jgi:hypothetical protein
MKPGIGLVCCILSIMDAMAVMRWMIRRLRRLRQGGVPGYVYSGYFHMYLKRREAGNTLYALGAGLRMVF